MKMVRIAETIHPRFHAPTVIPSDINTNILPDFGFMSPIGHQTHVPVTHAL